MNVKAVPNVSMLEGVYNELRVSIILTGYDEGDRYNASDETTQQLLEINKSGPEADSD